MRSPVATTLFALTGAVTAFLAVWTVQGPRVACAELQLSEAEKRAQAAE